MPKFTVHIYYHVRVPYQVEAATAKEAVDLILEDNSKMAVEAVGYAIRTVGEYAEAFDNEIIVDELDAAGRRVRSNTIGEQPFAVVEVSGGVADVTLSRDCTVHIVDWDNAKGGDPINLPKHVLAQLPPARAKEIADHNLSLEDGPVEAG